MSFSNVTLATLASQEWGVESPHWQGQHPATGDHIAAALVDMVQSGLPEIKSIRIEFADGSLPGNFVQYTRRTP